MGRIYQNIVKASNNQEQQLAILIDPDKLAIDKLPLLFTKINATRITHVFVGGSVVKAGIMDGYVSIIKTLTSLPLLIFPGDVTQITENSDALLFLSLISGRNPEYLISKQVEAVKKLKGMNLEIIPTAYLLIENGKETAVERVSNTEPMSRRNIQLISDTAKAGELLGMKLAYLEAGSGAVLPINSEIITEVKKCLKIPLIVGGGIKTIEQLNTAYDAGADLVVVGTAIEENESFLQKLTKE